VRDFLDLEDADLCLRLKLAGWNIRQGDEVAVVHAAQRASHHSVAVPLLARHQQPGQPLASPAYWRYLPARSVFSR
jgi:GT2 family glycosyltransferase